MRTICNKSLLAKKSSEVSQRQCRCAQIEFRIQIIIEEYSIHAKYVPNCMNTNSENGTRCTLNNHTHTNTRKNPSKRMKQTDTFRMLRVKIESFYHSTICNSIHFSSSLCASRSSLQFRMMGWLFMQRIHIWKWLHVCETRWLNKRSVIYC